MESWLDEALGPPLKVSRHAGAASPLTTSSFLRMPPGCCRSCEVRGRMPFSGCPVGGCADRWAEYDKECADSWARMRQDQDSSEEEQELWRGWKQDQDGRGHDVAGCNRTPLKLCPGRSFARVGASRHPRYQQAHLERLKAQLAENDLSIQILIQEKLKLDDRKDKLSLERKAIEDQILSLSQSAD